MTTAQNFENTSLLERSDRERVSVLIVGAGPVGMTLGLGLSRYGLPSLIVDDDDKLSEGSRAICVQRHTLEIFDRLGVVGPMLAKGVTWTLGRVFFGQQELFQIKFPGGSDPKFPPFINLQQFYTEQFLVDGLKEQTNCELRWKHKVMALSQTADSVLVTVETPDGQKLIEADWVLAADGARSPVRHLLNLDFIGTTYKDRFLIADIRAQLDYPNERWFWFDPIFNRGKSALLHPQPDNVWRIDWQLGPDIDMEAEKQPAALARRIKEIIGERPFEVVWATVYTFHQRHAARLKEGRVLLAGDAAHLMSPFGARGMNSGVQDANNLVWKLWLVLTGRAPVSLLDSYEVERHAAALENLHITDGTMAFITPHGKLRLLYRNTILRSSVRFKRLRKLVNSGRLSSPCRYQHSPVISKQLHLPPLAKLAKSLTVAKAVWQFVRGPQPGGVAPDARYSDANSQERSRLLDLLGREFVVLYWAGDRLEASLRQLETALQTAPDVPFKAYLVTTQLASLETSSSVQILWDETGDMARTYAAQPGTLYLVRPDGHVAARGLAFPLPQLADTLRLAIGEKRPAATKTRN